MRSLLWLVPAIPFASASFLAIFGPRFSRRIASAFGVGSVALSALITLGIAVDFLSSPPPEHRYLQTLWTWVNTGDLDAPIAFLLDPLSLVMIGVVTFVGFLIHLYSVEYMAGGEGYSRFFAYMNLFIGSMLILVLADHLLLLFLGWEGVGLCSFLLIGFWYTDPNNVRAAEKAFIVTRVGDTAFVIALALLFAHFRSLEIATLLNRAAASWPAGAPVAIAAAALILGGAVGKSAQLPLQVWLPDAMAGPTPTSALIHAATMVTAGVYLIARTHTLFTLAPPVQGAVAVIGAATLLIASFSALTQSDIKRVLAYSTVSQIGYMFLALGVGAWSAAIFHLVTHAFFKALLFLAAGAVIHAYHGEQNLFQMGGLRRTHPFTFWIFLIGGASLAGLPLVTAGFYSKGEILWETWALGGSALWAAGVIGAFLTSLYIFRVIFLAFFGAPRKAPAGGEPGLLMRIPLVVLGVLSIIGGFINLPPALGNKLLLTHFLQTVLPHTEASALHTAGGMTEIGSEAFVTAASLFGLFLAYLFYLRRPSLAESFASNPVGRALHQFWSTGWGFDLLYNRLFVRPYVLLAEAARPDVIDLFYERWLVRPVLALLSAGRFDIVDAVFTGMARLAALFYEALRRTETGRIRWYAAGVAAGTIFFLGW
ncbi:MAG TPA: NADH-quinone oxidoreductase subunit L, partial [Candidatus Manganitrophaceae bacterium]|nr:NADH-quinone oxidoreductase subunit L [Candidatus Manganitrophaceae bacterium]